jgi:uncharacterized protein YycO
VIEIALYRGISPLSLAIRWQTRGPYSHAAVRIPNGNVIEAWAVCGVAENAHLGKAHTPGTQVDLFKVKGLDARHERWLMGFLRSEIGCGYDYGAIFKFLTRRKGAHNERWFCSELVFAAFEAVGIRLLERVEAWQVSPSMLAWSPLLVQSEVCFTEGEDE